VNESKAVLNTVNLISDHCRLSRSSCISEALRADLQRDETLSASTFVHSLSLDQYSELMASQFHRRVSLVDFNFMRDARISKSLVQSIHEDLR